MLPPGVTLLFGIGAQKAGTTWLYDYLSGHPECHLPSEKEVHYFDVMRLAGETQHLGRRLARIRQLAANLPETSGPALGHATRRLRRTLDLIDIYAGDGRSHDRYIDHLLDGSMDERIIGDITPSYAMLDRETFAEMAGLAPDVRFVFVLRDPVDRAWSAIRQQVELEGHDDAGFRSRCLEIVDAQLRAPRGLVPPRSDYARTIRELEAAVAADRIHYMFYEDMFRPDPVAALARFLGLTPHQADFERRSRAAPIFALDARRLTALRAKLAAQYDFAEEKFGSALPDAWHRHAGIPAHMGEQMR